MMGAPSNTFWGPFDRGPEEDAPGLFLSGMLPVRTPRVASPPPPLFYVSVHSKGS